MLPNYTTLVSISSPYLTQFAKVAKYSNHITVKELENSQVNYSLSTQRNIMLLLKITVIRTYDEIEVSIIFIKIRQATRFYSQPGYNCVKYAQMNFKTIAIVL